MGMQMKSNEISFQSLFFGFGSRWHMQLKDCLEVEKKCGHLHPHASSQNFIVGKDIHMVHYGFKIMYQIKTHESNKRTNLSQTTIYKVHILRNESIFTLMYTWREREIIVVEAAISPGQCVVHYTLDIFVKVDTPYSNMEISWKPFRWMIFWWGGDLRTDWNLWRKWKIGFKFLQGIKLSPNAI